MTTTWTETAGEICIDALQHLSVIGGSETPGGADMQTALRGLDALLKELPLVGYTWPKLSGEETLSWTSGQTIDLPDDYYGYPVVWRTVAGQTKPLTQIPHAKWAQMPNRTQEGEPTHFYISPDNVLYLYPVPTTDPTVTLQYQRLVDDAVQGDAPDLPSYWVNPLGYGVADEISLKFSVPQSTRVEIAQRWATKRARALESSIASENISFEVAD